MSLGQFSVDLAHQKARSLIETLLGLTPTFGAKWATRSLMRREALFV